jgi:pantothenate synthetase
MEKQLKLIQSRLTRKQVPVSLPQIRKHITDTRPGIEEFEFDEAELATIVDELLSTFSQMVPVEPTDSTLSQRDKQELIQQVASTLDVQIPVNEIKLISQKMNWALSDRASLKEKIKSAIIAWIDHHIDQDFQETDSLIEDVQNHLASKLNESNRHFTQKAERFSLDVEKAVNNFRTTEATVLGFFKIPS